ISCLLYTYKEIIIYFLHTLLLLTITDESNNNYLTMGKRILLADDDLYIRDIYLEILKSDGFDVDTAINGEEALEKLHQGGYDLVILDVMMPKLDGIGVLDGLQKNPPLKQNGPI